MGVRGDRTWGDRQGCPQPVAPKDRDSSFHLAQQSAPLLTCGALHEHPLGWPVRVFWGEL